jgi:hypothetical protein
MPASAKSPAAIEIERLGFKFREVAQYDLSKLSPERRIQVRDVEHYAPRDAAERMAVQMSQSEFPPIVVTADGWTVDGNTRVEANQYRQVRFFPALELEVNASSASLQRLQELRALAGTLNAQNGTPLTAKERRRVAADLIDLNWKAEQIARAVGVPPAGVTAIRQEIEAQRRLASVGLGSNGNLKGASLRALGKSPVMALNNAPYRELADLAVEAGLNTGEISQLAKEARATGSDEGALSTIETARKEMADRIRQQELTGVSKPPTARMLRQHLGFVNRFMNDPAPLVETNQSSMEKHLEVLRQAVSVLQSVITAQEAVAGEGTSFDDDDEGAE